MSRFALVMYSLTKTVYGQRLAVYTRTVSSLHNAWILSSVIKNYGLQIFRQLIKNSTLYAGELLKIIHARQ